MIDLYSMKRWLLDNHKPALMVSRPSVTLYEEKTVKAIEYRLVVDRDPMVYTAMYYAPLGTDEENEEWRKKAFARLHWETERDLHIDFDMDELWREGESFLKAIEGYGHWPIKQAGENEEA